MSEQKYLKPGDIIRDTDLKLICMVMRHDEDGLLLAIPENDEIMVGDITAVEFLGKNIADVVT